MSLGVAVLLRSSAVIAFALVAAFVCWRASANLRRSILVWGFVAALATPALTFVLTRTPATRAVEVATSWARPRVDPGGLPEPVTAGYRWQRLESMRAADSELGLASRAWQLVFLGAAIALLPLLLAHVRVAWFTLRARKADEIASTIARAERVIGARARVAFSKHVNAPIATGVLTPRVLLPEEARAWDETRMYTVLLHELTHVRQRDALAQLVAELACALHWWNPIAWWAKRRLERERELAADEIVLATGLVPSAYASELLAIAADLDGTVPSRAGVPVLGRSKLSRRIECILEATRRPLPQRWQRALVAGTLFGVASAAACSTTPNAKPATSSRNAVAGASPTGAKSSIQPAIQKIVDDEIARTRREWFARGASVVVLEPKTGQVLGLGNPALSARNHVAASTFKPLVIAAALETGAVQPDDRFDCEQGQRKFPDGLVLRDAHAAGESDISEILAQSSNVCVSKIFDKLGGPRLVEWFGRFHLNDAMLDAPPGSLGPLDETSAGTMQGATIAIGFGAQLSPLHLASMYGAFANQGFYVAPSIALGDTRMPVRVMKSETATRVLALLEAAVERGTGKAARVEGVRVAGKTGTADVEDRGPEAHSLAYFAGIVPVDAPRYVIVVMVEDPKKAAGGGQVAAPLFARIASQIL